MGPFEGLQSLPGTDTNRGPTDPGDPDGYTADSGRTRTLSGPKHGGRSADGMGGTRAVG